MSLSAPTERHLPLAGTYNLRDVGGYPTDRGRQTRWRVLYRSDSLHRLDAAGQQRLIELGLRTVIDLRYARELTEAPNVFAASRAVRYLNLPLVPNPTERVGSARIPDLSEVYRSIVDSRQVELAAIYRALAEADGLPALLHCTAGKDRTGVVMALLLRVLGVRSEAIADDYAATEPCLRGGFMDDFREKVEARGIDWTTYLPLLACEPEKMLGLLDYVDARYGGVEAYMLELGLTVDELELLRGALIE